MAMCVNLLSTTEAGDVACCELTLALQRELEDTQAAICPVGLPLWNVDTTIRPLALDDRTTDLTGITEDATTSASLLGFGELVYIAHASC